MARKFGKADFRELEKLFKNVEKAQNPKSAESIEKVFEKILFEAGNKLLVKVKDNSEFASTSRGHLRRNWFIGSVARNGDNWEIEIYNNVEYASFVEYGHRGVGIWIENIGEWRVLHTETHWTEGRFMLTLSMQDMRKMLPQIADKHIQKYLKGLMKI